MNKLTGLKDVDREVLRYVKDDELLRICTIDRRMWNDVCDDNFLRRRLIKYPGIEKYKKEDESWKRFFLRVIYYISILKEEFKFDYTEGNFKEQYQLLKNNISMNKLLTEAASTGELSLVKFALKNRANLHFLQDAALLYAAGQGHLDIVKYLVEQGSNIPPYSLIESAAGGHFEVVKYLIEKGSKPTGMALTRAILFGHTEIVKYLIENGAEIHSENDYAIRWAAKNGELELVKFLIEKGANIHAENDYALLWAVEGGHFDIVQLLVEHGADIYAYNKKALNIAKGLKNKQIYDYLLKLY